MPLDKKKTKRIYKLLFAPDGARLLFVIKSLYQIRFIILLRYAYRYHARKESCHFTVRIELI